MTSSIASQFPLTVAGSVFGGIKQMAGRAFSCFMSNPAQNLALGLLGIAMTVSFSNALFWQSAVHPAPLFNIEQRVLNTTGNNSENRNAPHPRQLSIPRSEQLQPISQPLQQAIPIPVVPPTAIVISTVTNEILAQAQTALKGMGLFSGKVDGYYGPVTAAAIRAFESQQGLSVLGAMTPQIISKIISFTSPGSAQVSPSAPVPSQPVAQNQLAAAQPVVQSAEPHVDAAEQSVREQSVPDLLTTIAFSVAPSQPSNIAPAIATTPAYDPQMDKQLIEKIQRGLSSLGFYYSAIDGVLGESTARAIREFENFKSFEMTGLISNQLLVWLEEAGAVTVT